MRGENHGSELFPGDSVSKVYSSQIINKIVYGTEKIIYNPHVHYEYEMIYIVEGEALLALHNRTYTVGRDSIIFISNLETHSITSLKAPYIRYYITMSIKEVEDTLIDSKLLSVFKNRPPTFSNIFNIEAIKNEISFLFELLYKESKSKDEYAEVRRRCLIKTIILLIYKNNSEQFPVLKGNVKSQIYDIQKFIDRHYQESISLQGICDDFFISYSYLSHSFKELTGYSPKQYIMLQRLVYAKSLVTNTDISIADIAFQSGFSDVNNFIRRFRSYYKTTPLQMRKNTSESTEL